MPSKMYMNISNGNMSLNALRAQALYANIPVSNMSSALNAPLISRIHNIQSGCGSCGRH